MREYILKNAIRVSRLARLIAKFVDFVIVLILSVFFFPVGILLALFYLAFCDSLQDGQSLGKKFIGLRVISLEDGSPCSAKQSFLRNLPFLIPLVFSLIPLIGVYITIFLSIPILLLELYLLFYLDSGHRLGDVIAATTVMANDQDKVSASNEKKWWHVTAQIFHSVHKK